MAQVRIQGCLYLPLPWSQKSLRVKLHLGPQAKGSLPLAKLTRQQSYKRTFRKPKYLFKSPQESHSQIQGLLFSASIRRPKTLNSLLSTKRACISAKRKSQSRRYQPSISAILRQFRRKSLNRTRDRSAGGMGRHLCEKSDLSTNERGPLNSGATSGCSDSSNGSRALSGCKTKFIPQRANRSHLSENIFAARIIIRHATAQLIRINRSHQLKRRSQTSKGWKTTSARVSTPL